MSKVIAAFSSTISNESSSAHSTWSNLTLMDTALIPSTSDASRRTENHPRCGVLIGSNIAGALFFGALVYVLKNWASMRPVNDSTYLCLRSMYRVIDFLGLHSQNSVITSAVRREFPTRPEQVGAEVFVIVSWLGLAAAISMVLWLSSYARICRVLCRRAASTVFLFATPVCYLYVSWLTWKWPYEPVARAGYFFTESLPFVVFLAEVVCLLLLLLFLRRRSMPTWLRVLGISLHFVFWMFVLWSETRVPLFPNYARGLILVLLPASALIYILRRGQLAPPTHPRNAIWGWALAAALFAVTCVVWSPARNVELSHPKNLDSVILELSRGPCYGACPAYTVTVHGDGQVQYVSEPGYSRVQTRKSGTIEREKIVKILRMLDHVDFMTLEGRAFFWGFDSPSIGVRTSVDGKTKQVVSDTHFVGAPKGRQARFVETTREIDAILASSRWLKCEGECEISASSP